MKDFVERLQAALGGAYVIERELPLSGLGRLYLATEVATGRQVSVQALPPDIAGRLDVNRFRAGMDRVARLRHPGIAPIIASGAQQDIVWCVWPHPSGESLRYRLVRDGGLSQNESVQVLHDVADALAYGHSQGVSHGDLKVDNIYVERGRAVIAEFGIRSALNQSLGSSSGGIDARFDVHALAVAGQEMMGGRAGRVSQAVSRALSIDPSEQITDAATFREALGGSPRAEHRRVRMRLALLGTVLAVVAIAAAVLMRRRPELDANLVAVAPFETIVPAHSVWREGLMTMVSANLSGAGPIRTVSPTIVMRSWEGQVDEQSAAELAQRTGARLALYGRLLPMGADSVRLQAWLLDAQTGNAVAELVIADQSERLDRVGDTLTVLVLRELSRSRPLGASRRTSLGSTSLPALKAFLEGEQSFRRSEWDSAVSHYQRAIELDSTFAMAQYRAGIVMGWIRSASDSLSVLYLRRAGQYNHGLPVRDSLLIVAESLSAALEDGPADPRYWEFYRRIHATAAELTRRFPRDPEAWYEAGEVYYHWPLFATLVQTRAVFDHVIALDSAFAPAYIHPMALALEQGDHAAARNYMDRYLALHSRDSYADGVRLARRLLDPAQARSPAVQAILDTASFDLLSAAMQMYPGWADSLESAVRLTRMMNTARAGVSGRERPNEHLNQLRNALAYHGRFREALALGTPTAVMVAQGLFVGVVPADSGRRIMAEALREEELFHSSPAVMAAPWLAQQRDSVALRNLARRADQMARATDHPLERAFARFAADGALALAALARGDTATAISGLLALPDTACTRCSLYKFQLLALLDARRMDAEAGRLLAEDSPGFISPMDGYWALYRARLAARRGDHEQAHAQYAFVRAVWVNADAELQPYVREAKAALARDRD